MGLTGFRAYKVCGIGLSGFREPGILKKLNRECSRILFFMQTRHCRFIR